MFLLPFLSCEAQLAGRPIRPRPRHVEGAPVADGAHTGVSVTAEPADGLELLHLYLAAVLVVDRPVDVNVKGSRDDDLRAAGKQGSGWDGGGASLAPAVPTMPSARHHGFRTVEETAPSPLRTSCSASSSHSNCTAASAMRGASTATEGSVVRPDRAISSVS